MDDVEAEEYIDTIIGANHFYGLNEAARGLVQKMAPQFAMILKANQLAIQMKKMQLFRK
jgi:hypothetical protein